MLGVLNIFLLINMCLPSNYECLRSMDYILLLQFQTRMSVPLNPDQPLVLPQWPFPPFTIVSILASIPTLPHKIVLGFTNLQVTNKGMDPLVSAQKASSNQSTQSYSGNKHCSPKDALLILERREATFIFLIKKSIFNRNFILCLIITFNFVTFYHFDQFALGNFLNSSSCVYLCYGVL